MNIAKSMTNKMKQQLIIEALDVKPVINVEEEIRTRVEFLKRFIIDTQRNGFILGISGGQDSSLTGRLAQIAIDELVATGHKDVKFTAIRLPYGVQHDEDDAQLALNFINADEVITFNIKDSVDAFEKTFNITPRQHSLRDYEKDPENTPKQIPLRDYDKGNVKARMRMVTQYAYASANNLVVPGTGHASEYVGGYETKYGDGAVDILPLNGLNKRQGKQLLKALGAPARLYEKPPTADLLDEKPGQEDEAELGVRYDEIDDFLEGKTIDPKSAEMIINRFMMTDHKRRTPYTPQEFA